MKKYPILMTILMTGGLVACSAAPSNETDSPPQQEPDESVQNDTGETASDQNHEKDQTADDKQPQSDETQDSHSSDQTSGSETDDNKDQSDSNTAPKDSIDKEQKQMAIDTLNGLVSEGEKGKVYHLSDNFFVGKTTQTDVFNAIGKPELQDTFDRYTGSMGQASYDLRYNEKGLLVEARYLGTNVERQTNLGGITSKDLLEQLGKPDEKRTLKETGQASYIYEFGNYEIQFVMNEKDQADHVNLLLES